MSGPNPPPVMNTPNKGLPRSQFMAPKQQQPVVPKSITDRVPLGMPEPRVTHTALPVPAATLPKPGKQPVPLPRPRPTADQIVGDKLTQQADALAGKPPPPAVIDAIRQLETELYGKPKTPPPDPQQALVETVAKAAQAAPAPAPRDAARVPTAAPQAQFRPSQQIGETTYAPDPTVKYDKKGRALPGKVQKVNEEAKGSRPEFYRNLGITGSMTKASVQPELNKLIQKAKETPWLLTPGEDRILASMNDQQGSLNLSLEPKAVAERFAGYQEARQRAETEKAEAQLDKDMAREEKQKLKESQKKSAKGDKKKKGDLAEAFSNEAIQSAGAPKWEGTNAPTQADVKAGKESPDEFKKQFPDYKQPEAKTESEEGDD